MNAKVDKLKSEMGKKDKQISVLTRKAEEAMTAEAMHESNVQTI